jgi:hypothetical protein
MQRECNVVAVGELALHTRLWKKDELHPKSKKKCCQSVQLLNNVNVENDPLHRRRRKIGGSCNGNNRPSCGPGTVARNGPDGGEL